MEVQAIDVDDVRRFLEGAFNVAVFPNPIPNSVRPGFFVEDAVVGQGLLGFDNRFERLVLDLDEFSGIVGETRRLGDYSRDWLTLVKDLAHGHGEVANFLRMVGTDFDEGLGLRGNFLTGNRAHHAGQRFGSGGVDADNTRVGVRRAHKAEIEHFAQLDVVGELASAAQQAVFLFARE
jgi:hypothetical protein